MINSGKGPLHWIIITAAFPLLLLYANNNISILTAAFILKLPKYLHNKCFFDSVNGVSLLYSI